MSIQDALFYGALQGVSEFLPISSSSHLFLLTKIFQAPPPTPLMEIGLHLGSFFVLLVYFWPWVWKMLCGFFHLLSGKITPSARLYIALILAAVPSILFGFFIHTFVGRHFFERLDIIALTTLFFGLLLYVADKRPQRLNLKDLTFYQAFWFFGMAQCLAFIHGVSRSGITITIGRFLGYKREEAVRFAFLMALGVIKGAVFLEGLKLYKHPINSFNWSPLLLGIGMSFIVGLFSIHLLMTLLKSNFLRYIALYRMGLGVFLLFGIYWWGWS